MISLVAKVIPVDLDKPHRVWGHIQGCKLMRVLNHELLWLYPIIILTKVQHVHDGVSDCECEADVSDDLVDVDHVVQGEESAPAEVSELGDGVAEHQDQDEH